MVRALTLVLILLSTTTILQTKSSICNHSTNQDTITFASTTIFVPENHTSIQEAINAAAPGDTIYVNIGVYYENININKTITLIGKNPETTIIDGSPTNSSAVWIYGVDVRDVTVSSFTIRGSQNYWGLYLLGSPNATIENNIITSNHGGVLVDASNNTSLMNNTITGNLFEGLFFFQSSGNTMKNNTVYGNLYNFGIEESVFDDDIDESNLVNGKHIYIFRNQTGITIHPNTYPDMGYLALINCSDLIIKNLNLTNNISGIVLVQTCNTILENNTFAGNAIGLAIQDSKNNTLRDNSVASNGQGVTLTNSPENTLKNNKLTANQQHITVSGDELGHFQQNIDVSNTVDAKLVHYIVNQTELAITPNTFPNTGYIALVDCQNITAENMAIKNNIMLVAFCRNFTIRQNTIAEGGISLQNVWYGDISANTLSNGDIAISVINSYNNTVAVNNMTQNSNYGMLLESSAGNVIIDNNISGNRIGIELDGSINNIIVGNNITANNDYGILLTSSNHNTIYHNNFIDNAVPRWQAICGNIPSIADNVWDNGYPSGGNYWNDYNGSDQKSGTKQNSTGSDAIGDTPYDINFEQRDHYPLFSPFYDFTVTFSPAQEYRLEIVSNSSITDLGIYYWLSSPTPYLQPGQQHLLFFIYGDNGTTGFCRTNIPRNLINGTYTVLVDGQLVPATDFAESNSTYIYLYFTYQHSQHEIIIVSEYPVTIYLILAMVAFGTIIIVATKKRSISLRRGQA